MIVLEDRNNRSTIQLFISLRFNIYIKIKQGNFILL